LLWLCLDFKMTTRNRQRQGAMQLGLGLYPEFEGIVIPRDITVRSRGGSVKRRQTLLFDTTEAAFAHFNHWLPNERYERLKDAIDYVREFEDHPNTPSFPTIKIWSDFYSDKSVDEVAEELYKKLDVGVRREHEKMSKFLTGHAIYDAPTEPYLTRGGIWRADVVRRGDERTERIRKVRLTNPEVVNGEIDIAGFTFEDESPIFREHLGRERRHGGDTEVMYIGGYHLLCLIEHINDLSDQKKMEFRLSRNYRVFQPIVFAGNEHFVIEAVGRRYLPVSTKLRSQRTLFAISTYLNDHHDQLFSREVKHGLNDGTMFVGVGKYKFEDLPHREVLDAIDDLFRNKLGYEFNGFAVDFREYGPRFQTQSIVYTRPDQSRSVHIIYDGKFNVPPLYLLKIEQGEWGRERLVGQHKWNVRPTPKDNPFSYYNQWYPSFDRHSQQPLVNRITRPHDEILNQFPGLRQEYQRFAEQGRLNIR